MQQMFRKAAMDKVSSPEPLPPAITIKQHDAIRQVERRLAAG